MKIQAIKEVMQTADDLWKNTEERFAAMGIKYNDPRGIDFFGINRMNELLNMQKNALFRERDKIIREIVS